MPTSVYLVWQEPTALVLPDSDGEGTDA